MKKIKKKFDAVKTMRKIRDQLSAEFKGMSFEEQKRYIMERIHFNKTTHRQQREQLINSLGIGPTTRSS